MKEVVTEDNYKRKSLGRAITLCWVLLIVCFVVKLFGGNFFAYIGESEVVTFIINHYWLLLSVQFVFYMVQSYLFYNIMFKDKYNVVVFITSIIMFAFKSLIDLSTDLLWISYVVEFLGLIILPIILKQRWYMPILLNLALMLFQLMSMFTKNMGIVSFQNESVVCFVYMIDYYIMLTLCYLYSKKGDLDFMQFGFWFLSTDKTQLEAYKEHLVAKKDKKIALINKKHEKKITKIDARIAKAK